MLEGKVDVLSDYIEFIRKNDKEELLAGLITVLESSIKYNYSIDWVLDEFKEQVKELSSKERREDVRYYIDYMYLHTIYLYKRGKVFDTINLTLDILILCDKFDDGAGFRKAIAFYELLRCYASVSQQEIHQNIMKNILEREFLKDEKNIFVIGSRIVN